MVATLRLGFNNTVEVNAYNVGDFVRHPTETGDGQVDKECAAGTRKPKVYASLYMIINECQKFPK